MLRVSVIIPTYKRPLFLLQAIKSVLAQTIRDFEVIVVNDGSNDETENVVNSFQDKRIRYCCHKTPQGGAAARNTGIRMASGPYIAFLDDDDEWFPEKLRLQLEVIEHSPAEVGGIYTGYEKVEKETGRVVNQKFPQKKGYLFDDLMVENYIGTTSTMLLKKECFEKVGLFDERLPSMQDYDMWIRISREYKFEYLRALLLTYYIHREKISTNLEARFQGLAVVIEKYRVKPFCFRRNFAYSSYFKIAVGYCLKGDSRNGRKIFLSALKFFPFGLKSYIGLCLSCLGSGAFKNVMAAKAAISRSTLG